MTANLVHHDPRDHRPNGRLPSESDDPSVSVPTLTVEGAEFPAGAEASSNVDGAADDQILAYPPPAHFIGYRFCPLCGHGLTEQLVCERFRLACSSQSCRFVHWDNPKPVAVCLVEAENGIVLTKRRYPPQVGTWCLPGGFVEAHEDAELAAIREVFEETGLVVVIVRLLAVYSPIQGANEIILVYHVRPVGGSLVAGEEVQEVGAFAAHQLPSDIGFPQHADIINNWFKAAAAGLPVAS